MKLVAYYRVSTAKQGQSGLGIEAQRASVNAFAKADPIIEEFLDIESGKNDYRPQLLKAIEFAKQNRARLVIAKLDRLSRNLTFISQLVDSKVSFVCADMPDANEFTINIFAALAQQERKMISERTKSALDQKRIQIGEWRKGGAAFRNNPEVLEKAILKNQQKAQDNLNNQRACALIKELRSTNKTFRMIAEILNKNGFCSSRGGTFTATQVMRLYVICQKGDASQ
ncbi:recombinase family protein [Dyadobacter sp. CY107]|uniref:recombinase family protein n=1 Tax=Dyadobacter fanqingshengii TaxID=2906443 RepID=UPI001F2BC323|nr:recombinase family protein [Dyadobacter fanqingshengii]MCF2506853.1 recombinase family protein [Dyadobacter fanqingshengii]